PEAGALRALARELGLGARVRFLGHRDDVGDVLAALDLYLVTSDREGLSNSMLEALAAGVPVISTPVSGAAAALGPLEDGRVPGRIVPADVGAIARAVTECLADETGRRVMADAARARVRAQFDPADELDRWERLLTIDAAADVGVPAPAD
ncbi:MAG TPA: glycosyltransferase, partial [Alphaproteobacteria bacterium]|nr:glycosyltransferase [Alphaproteobacteria bacterium]